MSEFKHRSLCIYMCVCVLVYVYMGIYVCWRGKGWVVEWMMRDVEGGEIKERKSNRSIIFNLYI